jgi:hypothetical protein
LSFQGRGDGKDGRLSRFGRSQESWKTRLASADAGIAGSCRYRGVFMDSCLD